MRVIDANVIVYAFTTHKKTNPETLEKKENAKNIVKRLISGKETVYMTSIQVSETMNIIERIISHDSSIRVQKFLLDNPFIKIIEITHLDMINAHQIIKEYKKNKIGFNDAIAYIGMLKTNCTVIYAFDKHIDIFLDIKRLEK